MNEKLTTKLKITILHSNQNNNKKFFDLIGNEINLPISLKNLKNCVEGSYFMVYPKHFNYYLKLKGNFKKKVENFLKSDFEKIKKYDFSVHLIPKYPKKIKEQIFTMLLSIRKVTKQKFPKNVFFIILHFLKLPNLKALLITNFEAENNNMGRENRKLFEKFLIEYVCKIKQENLILNFIENSENYFFLNDKLNENILNNFEWSILTLPIQTVIMKNKKIEIFEFLQILHFQHGEIVLPFIQSYITMYINLQQYNNNESNKFVFKYSNFNEKYKILLKFTSNNKILESNIDIIRNLIESVENEKEKKVLLIEPIKKCKNYENFSSKICEFIIDFSDDDNDVKNLISNIAKDGVLLNERVSFLHFLTQKNFKVLQEKKMIHLIIEILENAQNSESLAYFCLYCNDEEKKKNYLKNFIFDRKNFKESTAAQVLKDIENSVFKYPKIKESIEILLEFFYEKYEDKKEAENLYNFNILTFIDITKFFLRYANKNLKFKLLLTSLEIEYDIFFILEQISDESLNFTEISNFLSFCSSKLIEEGLMIKEPRFTWKINIFTSRVDITNFFLDPSLKQKVFGFTSTNEIARLQQEIFLHLEKDEFFSENFISKKNLISNFKNDDFFISKILQANKLEITKTTKFYKILLHDYHFLVKFVENKNDHISFLLKRISSQNINESSGFVSKYENINVFKTIKKYIENQNFFQNTENKKRKFEDEEKQEKQEENKQQIVEKLISIPDSSSSLSSTNTFNLFDDNQQNFENFNANNFGISNFFSFQSFSLPDSSQSDSVFSPNIQPGFKNIPFIDRNDNFKPPLKVLPKTDNLFSKKNFKKPNKKVIPFHNSKKQIPKKITKDIHKK